MNKEEPFTIQSKPVSIRFTCPHCEMDQEIPWEKLDVPPCWSDDWGEVKCPECGKKVLLGEWTYD